MRAFVRVKESRLFPSSRTRFRVPNASAGQKESGCGLLASSVRLALLSLRQLTFSLTFSLTSPLCPVYLYCGVNRDLGKGGSPAAACFISELVLAGTGS